MFKKREKMRWQQPQKQELHPTELYARWSQAVSAQMAESEVTGCGKKPAWCQETTWSFKKKKKKKGPARSQVSGLQDLKSSQK